MGIDTSALAAVFFHEPEGEHCRTAIFAAETRLICAVTVLETGLVIEGRRGAGAGREFDLFATRANLQLVSVDPEPAELRGSAWRRNGRNGRGRHPAGFNVVDCFTYALSKSSGSLGWPKARTSRSLASRCWLSRPALPSPSL
jgi:ribonuclease VapC